MAFSLILSILSRKSLKAEPDLSKQLSNQDLHMVEMEDFKYGGTNITAFRLVDPGSELVQQVRPKG